MSVQSLQQTFNVVPYISTQLSDLRHTEVRILLKIPHLIQTSERDFPLVAVILLRHWSALNTPKSLGVPTAKNPED
jgi:hypothetical protein